MNIQIESKIIGLNDDGTEKCADSVVLDTRYILGSNNGAKTKVSYFCGADKVYEHPVLISIPSSIIQEWTDDEPLIDYVFNEIGLIRREEEVNDL